MQEFIEDCLTLENFNSIKVRLERNTSNITSEGSRFQFHKGAIRTVRPTDVTVPLLDFNSIKVRLELHIF